MFQLDENRGLVPYYFDKGEAAINNKCRKAAGLGWECAAKIMQDGWQIKSDYPWQ